MSLFALPTGDAYDKRCGEVFLTLNGNIIFHCTLCENKYRGIHEYAVHIIDKHFDPAILDEDCISANSSDFLEEEVIDDIAKDFDTIPFDEVEQLEESFTDGEAKEFFMPNNLQSDIAEDFNTIEESNPLVETMETLDEKKQQQKTKEHCKRSQKLTFKAKNPKTKNESIACKIRMVNEEAALALEAPTFQQPMARTHIPDSERKHKCNFCGFAFKDESNLIAHIKRHSGKKNFQCSYCSKLFCTRSELEEHSRRHTGERPFKCDFGNCDKSYVTRSELNMHIKRHKNDRKFKCEVCQRAFYDRCDLREHFVSHTQERNHECLVCHAKFPRRKALINHIKLHENKREYECNICGATFNQKPGLNSHIKTRHKDVQR